MYIYAIRNVVTKQFLKKKTERRNGLFTDRIGSSRIYDTAGRAQGAIKTARNIDSEQLEVVCYLLEEQ